MSIFFRNNIELPVKKAKSCDVIPYFYCAMTRGNTKVILYVTELKSI